MTEKVAGFDKSGNITWTRAAREYDRGIPKSFTPEGIGKIIAMIFLAGVIYTKFDERITANHQDIVKISQQSDSTLNVLNNYVHAMDSYLSAKTGRTFKNGVPSQEE